MSNNNKNGSFAGKGYYIALILCAAAIGITSYVYYRSQPQPEQASVQQPEQAIPAGTLEVQEDVAAMAPSVPETRPAPTEQTATEPARKKGLKTRMPVSGSELSGYSMEALSYNQTTRDWRVHNGMDIAAEEGTPVCAAAEGTVYSVGEEDTMGYTVVIRHEGGYTTTYSSLREDIPVTPGDTVAVGQTIGYVGTSALVETALGSHVHFGVSHQNKAMDPAEFLALGQS